MYTVNIIQYICAYMYSHSIKQNLGFTTRGMYIKAPNGVAMVPRLLLLLVPRKAYK